MKSIYRDFAKYRYFYLIILVLGAFMSLTLHAGMQGADGREYLRWTHSLVFDQDLHLLDDFAALGGSYRLTPTGYVFERVNIGLALLWTPFYGAAMLLMPLIADQTGAAYPADGMIALLWVNFTSWLYPVLGGILTFGVLRPWFSGRTLALSVAAILLGTPVLFYMATFPLSSHPASIFLAALLLYLWRVDLTGYLSGPKIWSTPVWRYLALGVVCGWLTLVASYNIVFLLLPGFDLFKEGVNPAKRQQLLAKGLALGLGGLTGFLPQMIVWWFLFGSPFYSPYSGQLLWSEPYIFETLFSTFHSLFFYAPVLLLVIPGWWQLRRSDGWAALSLGLVWLLLTYVVSINVAWWAGSSFGNRYFLTLTPFFVWGLATLIKNQPRWAVALILPAVLWTLGLYLQFLSGVGLTSDSRVYPAIELAQGQITAWANILNILPHLWVNLPWPLAPAAVLPMFIFILGGVSRWVYGWSRSGLNPSTARETQPVIIAGSGLLLIGFIAVAGWRGNQTKASLASQGFYDQPHEVVLREVKEIAGQSGLVTRALYHEQTGQPDRAIADLKRAAELWKLDSMAVPTRLYLGPNPAEALPATANLHLDYPGNARLLGYQILEVHQNFIKGELFWEKLAGEKFEVVVTPVVRAFDATANNLGNVTLEFPFPAYYVPAGSFFKDTFFLQLDNPAEAWVWLAVSLAEDPNAPPLNGQGQAESGIIGAVNVKTFPSAALVSAENGPELIGRPLLLLNQVYQPGQTIPLQFVGPTAANTHLELILLDAAGKAAMQQQFSLPSQPPLVGNTTLCLTLPATLRAGNYWLTFALQPPEVESRPIEADPLPLRLGAAQADPRPNICTLLKAGFARRYEAPAPQHAVEADLTDQIKLLGYDLAVIPQAGSVSAGVTLHWQAQTRVTQNYLVLVQLLDAAGQPVIAHSGVPVHGTRPTSTWLNQELILDEHLLTVPVLAPGVYRLNLALLDEQTGQPVEGSGRSQLTLQDVSVP